MEVDLIRQFLNQLELHFSSRKPIDNLLIEINFLCDQAEELVVSSKQIHEEDTLIDEGLASHVACVFDDSESYIIIPATEINFFDNLYQDSVDNSQTEVDGDSGDLAISQVSSFDLSLDPEYVDNGHVGNFLACWNLFYMCGLMVLSHVTRMRSKNVKEANITSMNFLRWCGNYWRISDDLDAGKSTSDLSGVNALVKSTVGLFNVKGWIKSIIYLVKSTSGHAFRNSNCCTIGISASLRYSLYDPHCISVSNGSKQIRLDLYLFLLELNGLNSLYFKKYGMLCIFTLVSGFGLWLYCIGCTLSIKIQLHLYLFELEDKGQNCRTFVTTHLRTINLVLFLEDDKMTSLHEKECDGLGQVQKIALVLSSIQTTSRMLAIIKIVASKQVKLDFYLFAGVWMSLTSMALLKYGMTCTFMMGDESAAAAAPVVAGN